MRRFFKIKYMYIFILIYMYVFFILFIMKCLFFKKFDFLIVYSNYLLVYGIY